jgi:hypothetical protein
VARYLRQVGRRGDPAKRWLAFLHNHREIIVAFDFFTVPTVTFQLLYCFFVIEHGRRKILDCNVTRHPSSDGVIQQLRETFPQAAPYRYVILDRDSQFADEVIMFLKATGLTPKRASIQSPWQNGLAERWVGSCRREILDHLIVMNERHLLRLVREYAGYQPSARLARQRHPGPAGHRAEASSECHRDGNAASRWSAPSLRVARGGVEALGLSLVAGRRRRDGYTHDHARCTIDSADKGLSTCTARDPFERLEVPRR